MAAVVVGRRQITWASIARCRTSDGAGQLPCLLGVGFPFQIWSVAQIYFYWNTAVASSFLMICFMVHSAPTLITIQTRPSVPRLHLLPCRKRAPTRGEQLEPSVSCTTTRCTSTTATLPTLCVAHQTWLSYLQWAPTRVGRYDRTTRLREMHGNVQRQRHHSVLGASQIEIHSFSRAGKQEVIQV